MYSNGIDDSGTNFSYLEDSGIFLETKENSARKKSTTSRKPPKVQGKRCSSSRSLTWQSSPRCVVGLEHSNGVFPSHHYKKNHDISYLYQCFEVLEEIGSGSFGSVHKVQSKDNGQLYAVKAFKEPYKSVSHRQRVLNEVFYHYKVCDHPNIVTIYQAWEEEGLLYILLELCESSLEVYTQQNHDISEPMVWKTLLDILHAVKHIHDNDLVHMDIKLANILIGSDGSFKLSDFGLVVDLTKEINSRDISEGDSKYLAPEVLKGIISKAADIFSLGISVLELGCDLVLPGYGEEWQQLRKNKIPQQQSAKLSKELVSTISSMMNNNLTQRPTVNDILQSHIIQRKINPGQIMFFSGLKSLGENLLHFCFYQAGKLFEIWLRLRDLLFGNREEITTPTNSPNSQNNLLSTPCHSTPIGYGRAIKGRKIADLFSSSDSE